MIEDLRLHGSALDFAAVALDEDSAPTRGVLAIGIAFSGLFAACGSIKERVRFMKHNLNNQRTYP